MQSYVLGFVFNLCQTEVLLTCKQSPEWQCGYLNGIGGKIEQGESPIKAMHREFDEATEPLGFVDYLKWRNFGLLSGVDFSVHLFRASALIRHVATHDRKPTEDLVYVDLSKPLPSNVLPNLRWLIPMAQMDNSRDWPFFVSEKCTQVGISASLPAASAST